MGVHMMSANGVRMKHQTQMIFAVTEKGKTRMFDFAEKTSHMSAIEILNYYRSLYNADPYGTEHDIVANAIKDVLCIINSQKDEIERLKEKALLMINFSTIECKRRLPQ